MVKSGGVAEPVPVKAENCVPTASTTESVATIAAAEVGVKTTVTVQLAPAASDVPQVLVEIEKELAFVPLRLMEVIASAAVPALVNVKTCVTSMVPTVTVPNAAVAGVRVACGAVGVTPVQLSADATWAIGEGKFAASVAERAPLAVGVQVTLMVQFAPMASVEGHALVCANELAFVPNREMLLKLSAAVPVFESVSVCAVLVVPTVVDGNISVDGASVGCGTPVTVPATVAVWLPAVALSATVRVAAKVPTEVFTSPSVILQVAPAASVVPQLLLCVKAVGFAPPSVMDVIVNVVAPVFVSVAVWLVAPNDVVALKANVEGASVAVTEGAVPVPDRATVQP